MLTGGFVCSMLVVLWCLLCCWFVVGYVVLWLYLRLVVGGWRLPAVMGLFRGLVCAGWLGVALSGLC